MTIVAAGEVISSFNSHGDMDVLEVQWGLEQDDVAVQASQCVWLDLGKIAAEEEIEVMTVDGRMSLRRFDRRCA